jgi:pilus assembly protein CpaC
MPISDKLANWLAAIAGLSLALIVASVIPASANGDLIGDPIAGYTIKRTTTLGLNKSLIIELPRPARDVLVSNPAIADAVMRTTQRIYVTGIAVGQTNVFVFDDVGRQILNLELDIERDISGLEATLNRLIPGSRISVELINDNIVLSGSVKNADASRKAMDIANMFANGGANASPASQPASVSGTQAGGVNISIGGQGGGTEPVSRIVNLLSIEGEDQVHLKVTVAEVQRTVAKQLGIDTNSAIQIGKLAAGLLTNNPFAVASAPLSNTVGAVTYDDPTTGNGINATLRALEQEGMIRTLAEPTLTAISGEAANFLAGGEFPVPVARDSDGNVTVEYKPFGVSLNFSPVVLSEGRISLRIKTEVSELSNEGNLEIAGLTLPSIKVRRAETTLELPSGGSLVLGGLLQDSIRQTISGLPGLKQLPVLGTLFRSRDFAREETELVILVTPYLVKPVSVSALARPDEGLIISSDPETILFGRLNQTYGDGHAGAPQGAYKGHFGFIFE